MRISTPITIGKLPVEKMDARLTYRGFEKGLRKNPGTFLTSPGETAAPTEVPVFENSCSF